MSRRLHRRHHRARRHRKERQRCLPRRRVRRECEERENQGGQALGSAGIHRPRLRNRLDYAASKDNVAAVLGGASTRSAWSAKEIGDGNINFVYIITGASADKSVIVKQGLPFVRCVGESWPLTQEPQYEAEALIQAHKYCPAHVPEVYIYDPTMATIVMQYLEPPHIILRGGIIEGKLYPKLAEHVGEYLATTLYKSSALSVGGAALRRARQAFGQNEDMCELTEQVIFTEPYGKADNNHWTTPQLDDVVGQIQSDAALKLRRQRVEGKVHDRRSSVVAR